MPVDDCLHSHLVQRVRRDALVAVRDHGGDIQRRRRSTLAHHSPVARVAFWLEVSSPFFFG